MPEDEFIKNTTQELFGIPVFDGSLSDLIRIISQAITNHTQIHIVTLNPEMIARQASDPRFRESILRAEYRIADGKGIILASKILGKRVQHRIPGVELVEALFRESQQKHWSFYFLGSREEVIAVLAKTIQYRFPGLRIAGFHHGYFQESSKILEDINRHHSDVLLVGLGSPRQELWIDEHRTLLQASILIGVGGSFDVLSGNKRRAPRIFRRLGLEWVYRIFSEPRRLKRVLPAFWRFGWVVLRERFGWRK